MLGLHSYGLRVMTTATAPAILTPTETETLALVAEGWENEELCERFSVTCGKNDSRCESILRWGTG